MLKIPTSQHHIWVTGNVLCRWRHSSDWHHALQNQNLSISLEGFCRFPLGTENRRKRQKNAIKDAVQVESDLALPAEQISVHCMAMLCPSRVHEGRQKTNTPSKQITLLHLLLLLKGEQKEPPACEPVLVMFLTASLQSARKRPCQENSSTRTSASLQWTKAQWNIWWQGF